jgi:hypothetical protein
MFGLDNLRLCEGSEVENSRSDLTFRHGLKEEQYRARASKSRCL